MAIELNRIVSTPMAQTLTIRSHALVVDGTAAEGGDDTGPNPHDLYDAALGACKAGLRWYSLISTASSRSTTPLDTRPATNC